MGDLYTGRQKGGTDQRRYPLQATMSARTVPSARPARLLARIAQLIDQRLKTLAVLGRLGNNQNRIVAGKRAKHIGQLCRINSGGEAVPG